MVTYESRESALDAGVFGIGYEDQTLREKVLKKVRDPVEEELDWPSDGNRKIDLYRIKDPEGEEIGIGIEERSGRFHLWSVDLETGVAMCN